MVVVDVDAGDVVVVDGVVVATTSVVDEADVTSSRSRLSPHPTATATAAAATTHLSITSDLPPRTNTPTLLVGRDDLRRPAAASPARVVRAITRSSCRIGESTPPNAPDWNTVPIMDTTVIRHDVAATTGGWASAHLNDGRLVVLVPHHATDDEVAAAVDEARAAITD